MNLIVIQQLKDGTKPKAIYEYATEDEAKSALYTTMGSAVADANMLACSCGIADDDLRVYKIETFKREATEA